MNTKSGIAMFGTVVAIAAGMVLSGAFSETSVNSNGYAPEAFAIMGHAEFIVTDVDGVITAYAQTDNIVTETGRDCVANLLFKNGTTINCSLSANYDGFNYIAIGNGTADAVVGKTALTATEVVRQQTLPTFTTAIGATQAEIVLTTAFLIDDTMGNLGAAATITESGLFDASSGGLLFAILEIPNSGVAVAAGDTLTVTWTVDIGAP